MYIGFLNFLLNSHPSLKRQNNVDLKKLYNDKFANARFPINLGGIELLKCEICKTSRGCTPKRDGERVNYLTLSKNTNRIVGKANVNDKFFVMMNVYGTIEFANGVFEKIHFRIPKSGIIKVSVGLKNQQKIKFESNTVDEEVTELMGQINTTMYQFLKPNITFIAPPSIIALSIHGLNLFNPDTGECPPHKIKNFSTLMNNLNLPGYQLASIVRSIGKVYLKMPDHPTIGITSWGSVDFSGVKRIVVVKSVSDALLKRFNIMKNQITYNNTSKKTVAKTKKILSSIPKAPQEIPKTKKSLMALKKPALVEIAKRVGVSYTGTKEELTKFILSALRN